METSLLSILALVAIGLLVTVTVGIIYLTTVEWRDRRRQDQDKRVNKPIVKRR